MSRTKKKFQECNEEGPTQATAITADYDRTLHALEHACRAAEDHLYQLSYEAIHDKMKVSSVFGTSKLNGEITYVYIIHIMYQSHAMYNNVDLPVITLMGYILVTKLCILDFLHSYTCMTSFGYSKSS